MDNLCEICQKPSKTRCSVCRLVFYCSAECQKRAWTRHRKYCAQSHSPLLIEAINEKNWTLANTLIHQNIGIYGECQLHGAKLNGCLAQAVLKGAPLGIIGKLVEKNLDVDDDSGRMGTPLSLAVMGNRKEVVEYFLVMCKGNVHTQTANGSNLVHLAMRHNVHPELLQTLVDFGANVNQSDHVGRLPLMYAIALKDEDGPDARPSQALVTILLSRGARIDPTHFSVSFEPTERDFSILNRIQTVHMLIVLLGGIQQGVILLSVDLVHMLKFYLL